MSDFNKRFDTLCEHYGVTALVRDTGISNSQVYRLRNAGDITRENLVTVCRVTGADMVWLASGAGSMFPENTPHMESRNQISEPQTVYGTPDNALSPDEQELLALFRSASLATKSRVLNELIK